MFKTIEAPNKEYCGVSISSIRRRKRLLRLKQIEQINQIAKKEFLNVPLKDETLKQYKIIEGNEGKSSEGMNGGEPEVQSKILSEDNITCRFGASSVHSSVFQTEKNKPNL